MIDTFFLEPFPERKSGKDPETQCPEAFSSGSKFPKNFN